MFFQYRPFYHKSGDRHIGLDVQILDTLSKQMNFRYKSNYSHLFTYHYYTKVIDLLPDILFTYSYSIVPSVDGKWGANVKGTWNGMIGMVHRGVGGKDSMCCIQ